MPDFVPEVTLWEYRDGSVHAEMQLASFFEDGVLICHLDAGTLRSACGKPFFGKLSSTGLGDPGRVDCLECRKFIAGVTLTGPQDVDRRAECAAWRDWFDKPHKDDRYVHLMSLLPEEYQGIENPLGLEKLLEQESLHQSYTEQCAETSEAWQKFTSQRDGHQWLLAMWYGARKSLISERSGDIAGDTRKLHARAVEYAKLHDLAFEAELDEWHQPECEGHESTDGPIGNVTYCDGSCRS